MAAAQFGRPVVKDILEPFLYPHNLFLWGLLLACVCYRRKGLWLLFFWFYLSGNTLVANQLRDWYQSQIQSSLPAGFSGDYVLLGCGGNEHSLPDCARNRILQLARMLNAQQRPAKVYMTTLHCGPYLKLLQEQSAYAEASCFDAGPTTYNEMATLEKKLDPAQHYLMISSDYHALRVAALARQHGIQAQVFAASSSTFRPVNCGLNCLLTVNLSNFDLWSKLSAEGASMLVYHLTKGWTDWYQPVPENAKWRE